MSYCLNPKCSNRKDPANVSRSHCRHCGSDLLLEGRYRLKKRLGVGGFAETYEIDDRGSRKVIKVLLAELNKEEKAIELFRQEALVLSQLSHPGIPHVDDDGFFEFTPKGSKEPLYCFVMEYIEGDNLYDWMKQRKQEPINEELAIDWLFQLAEILEQVHAQNYFHRDIKPENIMCKPNGQLVLIDFGTAREVTGTIMAFQQGDTQAERATGIVSPGYTAPEQVNGKPVPQSDFYSLGRTFVFLLTGKPPTEYPENPRTGKLQWQKFATHISPELMGLIDDLMALASGKRPQNPQEIIQRLENILNPPPPPTKITVTQWQDYKRPLLIGGAVCLLAFGALELYGSWRYGFLFANPALLLNSLPSSRFLDRSLNGEGAVGAIALTPDGKMLASASDNNIILWSIPAGKQLINFNDAHKQTVKALAISPNGKILVSGSADGQIRFWDLQKKIRMRTVEGHPGGVNAIAFNSNGQTIVSGGNDKQVKLWSVQTGSRILTWPHQTAVNGVAFSKDSKSLMAGLANGKVMSWHLEEKQTKELVRGGATIQAIAVSSDGRTLATGDQQGNIRLINLVTGKSLQTLKKDNQPISSLIFTNKTQNLISSSNQIWIWDIKSGKVKNKLIGHAKTVEGLALSQDNQRLLSGSPDRTIKIWKIP